MALSTLVPRYSSDGQSGKKKDFFFFFLPKYCSEMNPIELEWLQLKRHELAGQMFEDELDKRLCRHGWS